LKFKIEEKGSRKAKGIKYLISSIQKLVKELKIIATMPALALV